MIKKEYIEEVVSNFLNASPLFLVSVTVSPSNKIVIEIDSDDNVDIDTCVSLSKDIETHLNRDEEDFELEVGSAGLTSPFKVLRQYQKYLQKEVEVLTKEGQKYSGILSEVTDAHFTVEVSEMLRKEGDKRKKLYTQPHTFSYEEIKYTKYIINFK